MRTLIAIAMLVTLTPGPALAADSDVCMAAKLKAFGKLEAALLGCQAKVAQKNDSSGLAACQTKAAGKFQAALAKAGACLGVEASCNTNAGDCQDAVVAAFADTLPSKCEAAKRKAAGKLARSEIGCYSKAAKAAGPVDSACLTKATTKFADALTKAGACPDGGGPTALVEAACVAYAATLNMGGMVVDVCPDKDECALATDNCDPNATCANTTGSFTCTCNEGFAGDGMSCTPACGNDCWGEFGCETSGGRCVRFTCRAGDAGPTFCDSCLGWDEITYDQWMNQGYCGDVIQKFRATEGTASHCGSDGPTCCDGSANCGTIDNAWHFSDGVDTHFVGPCTGCVGDTNCSYWDSTDNSPYTRITACERMF